MSGGILPPDEKRVAGKSAFTERDQVRPLRASLLNQGTRLLGRRLCVEVDWSGLNSGKLELGIICHLRTPVRHFILNIRDRCRMADILHRFT